MTGLIWMVKLTELGFSGGIIFETIVSTYNPDGTANAAPMGTTMHDPQTLNLTIFNSSQTSRNLKTHKSAVINLTNNIDFFYKTAFKETNPEGRLPQEWFEKAEKVNAPKLRLADATVEVSVTDIAMAGTEKTNFFCRIEETTAAKMFPQVHCRAMALTLEAIIHATRVKVFVKDDKQQKNVGKLLVMIENSNEVVNRVAPNSAYSAVMADLMKRIDSWRNKP
jgi:uncharacterized protein